MKFLNRNKIKFNLLKSTRNKIIDFCNYRAKNDNREKEFTRHLQARLVRKLGKEK